MVSWPYRLYSNESVRLPVAEKTAFHSEYGLYTLCWRCYIERYSQR